MWLVRALILCLIQDGLMQAVMMKLRMSFKLLMKFINYICLCNRYIRRNFTFVNIRMVPLLVRVKVFSLVHVH